MFSLCLCWSLGRLLHRCSFLPNDGRLKLLGLLKLHMGRDCIWWRSTQTYQNGFQIEDNDRYGENHCVNLSHGWIPKFKWYSISHLYFRCFCAHHLQGNKLLPATYLPSNSRSHMKPVWNQIEDIHYVDSLPLCEKRLVHPTKKVSYSEPIAYIIIHIQMYISKPLGNKGISSTSPCSEDGQLLPLGPPSSGQPWGRPLWARVTEPCKIPFLPFFVFQAQTMQLSKLLLYYRRCGFDQTPPTSTSSNHHDIWQSQEYLAYLAVW